jgi:hypothetical protein
MLVLVLLFYRSVPIEASVFICQVLGLDMSKHGGSAYNHGESEEVAKELQR